MRKNVTEITQEQRDTVRSMAAFGIAAADIARLVAKGMPEADFLAAFSDELEEAQIQAAAKLQEQLYTQAVNGNTAALLHLSRQNTGQTLPSIASTQEMCSYIGISKVALHDMRKRGVIEPVSRDRWDVKKTVRAICVHYREIAAGRKSDGKQDDAPDLVTERALLARAQRAGIEMENEVKRGNLLPVDRVQVLMADIYGPMIRALDALGDRIERDLRVSPAVVEYIRGEVGAARDQMEEGLHALLGN